MSKGNDDSDAIKLKALREAARVGFADLDAGRYRDLDDAGLDDFVADLGERASKQVRVTAKNR